MEVDIARLGRLVTGLSVLLVLLSSRQQPSLAQPSPSPTPAMAKLAPPLQAWVGEAADEVVMPVIVTLRERPLPAAPIAAGRAARSHIVVSGLKTAAARAQRPLLAWLHSPAVAPRVRNVRSLWIANAVALEATPDVIAALAARPDVVYVAPDEAEIVPAGAPRAVDSHAGNLSVIGVPALWDLGFTGQGVVVATVDTGVDETHPELLPRWRGGTNSWFDPYDEHPLNPTDLQGHGTWVTGIMVAGDASGTALGVAPDAWWIAAKIFNDRGGATRSAIHETFQWILDPDGDPATDDAPHVVVNAWSFSNTGCDLDFQPDLLALRAAGILPVFAGGNFGPNTETDVSPGNNPAAFAVGATNNDDAIYLYSSRGPSACGETATIYPELVAPGVAITTTDRTVVGLPARYTTQTGTSFAAPHVAGALALLLSAYPGLSADTQATLLLTTALDLGATGPDNVFGYGRLDIRAAYDAYEPPPVYTLYLPLYVIDPYYPIYLPVISRAP